MAVEKLVPAELPIAIVGAGPVGLAAAAHLVCRGEKPLLFEMGPTVASSIFKWGHVRLFSPWQYLIDEASASLLSDAGWIRRQPALAPRDATSSSSTYGLWRRRHS
jgi:2-polyprenyl-6-methoxyphenol hydroxylase-like FAD-dependent oxidoreductase